MVESYEDQFKISESILGYQHKLLERQDSKARSLFTILTLTSAVAIFTDSLISEKFWHTSMLFMVPFIILSIAYFAVLLLIIYFALRVLGPHEKPLEEIPKHWKLSISFYEGILKKKPDDYVNVIERVTLEEKVIDNARQIYIIAKILDHKIRNMKKASKLMRITVFSFVLMTILGAIISLNLFN